MIACFVYLKFLNIVVIIIIFKRKVLKNIYGLRYNVLQLQTHERKK